MLRFTILTNFVTSRWCCLILIFAASFGSGRLATSAPLNQLPGLCSRIVESLIHFEGPQLSPHKLTCSTKDQGQNPLCAWYAKTSLLEANIYKDTGVTVNLSPEYLVSSFLVESAKNLLKSKISGSTHKKDLESVIDDEAKDFFNTGLATIGLVPSHLWKPSEKFLSGGYEKFLNAANVLAEKQLVYESAVQELNNLTAQYLGELTEPFDALAFADQFPQYYFFTVDYIKPYAQMVVEDKSPFMIFTKFFDRTFIEKSVTVNYKKDLLNLVKHIFSMGRTTYIGLHWDQSLEDPKTGNLSLPKEIDYLDNNETSTSDDHAVLLYSYDPLSKRYWVLNSWGSKSGKRGKHSIEKSYLDRHLSRVIFALPASEAQELQQKWIHRDF